MVHYKHLAWQLGFEMHPRSNSKASTLHGIEAFLLCIQPHMLIVRAPRQSPGVVFLVVITTVLVAMAAVALAILMLD